MKHIGIIIFCCLCIQTTSWSQSMDDQDFNATALDRVQAQRVAFITEKIDLTSKEAEKFWPLFNEYEKSEKEIRKRYRLKQKRAIDMTNEEARANIVGHFDLEQELLDLKRTSFLKLADTVSPKKLVNFTKADREFKRMLLERMRNRNRRRNGRN